MNYDNKSRLEQQYQIPRNATKYITKPSNMLTEMLTTYQELINPSKVILTIVSSIVKRGYYMAETSFRKINTQLWLALIKADLTKSCYKVLLTVIHFTLGYNQRIEADISLTTFMEYTDLSRPAVKQALRLLQCKNIIGLVQRADNRHSTVYSLNVNFETWNSVKAHLPSRVQVGLPSENSKTYPQDIKNLPPRGKVAAPATTHIKKKENYKKNSNTPLGMSSHFRESIPPPPMSLSHYAPKGKAEANSLTNGSSVLPGEDRTTLESDPSVLGSPSRGTYRKRIEQYLKANSLASMKAISRDTGKEYSMVNITLSNGKNKVFRHLKEQRVWGLINPQKESQYGISKYALE